MTRQQRLNQLLELVGERGHVSIADVTQALDVSPATARRDIGALADQRLVLRTHGGATALGSTYELPLQYKLARQAEAKVAIARAAAALIGPGQTVALNGGTTTTEVARQLARGADTEAGLTVVTNALNIAFELSVRPHVTIVVVGGIARTQSYELVGPIGEDALSHVNVDTAIIGVDGISARGLTTIHPDEAQTNARLIAAARRTIVVADSTKHGRTTFATIAPLDRIDVLVTDSPVAGPLADALDSADVELVLAGDPAEQP